jgi:hypothetical protein
MSSVVLARAG